MSSTRPPAPATPPSSPPPDSRRRRTRLLVVGLLTGVLVLLVGLLLGSHAVERRLEDRLAGALACTGSDEADATVDLDVSTWRLPLALAGGSLGDVGVHLERDDATLDLRLRDARRGEDGALTHDGGSLTLVVPLAQAREIAAGLAGRDGTGATTRGPGDSLTVESVRLRGGAVVLQAALPAGTLGGDGAAAGAAPDGPLTALPGCG
ncbi:hypothetical protein [Nocardioides bruguierae]|uniref:hypothetical protein n=1 Tax=Nocardioides bruguierae TaxID=2945102 RepID=UPI002020C16C|nr:hypothetical protein [Nocardioides bruguierae]MCL8024772.1 hypothetical protein [Nocardioides bruguierae]